MRDFVIVLGFLLASTSSAHAQSSAWERARACAMDGDHECVVRELTEPTTAREYELLIASLRMTTDDAATERRMREYLTRFPGGRQAAVYRQYLVAHAG